MWLILIRILGSFCVLCGGKFEFFRLIMAGIVGVVFLSSVMWALYDFMPEEPSAGFFIAMFLGCLVGLPLIVGLICGAAKALLALSMAPKQLERPAELVGRMTPEDVVRRVTIMGVDGRDLSAGGVNLPQDKVYNLVFEERRVEFHQSQSGCGVV